MKAAKIVLGLAILFGPLVALVSCYKGTPPCDPSTVDWPRCRPWDPPMRARDAGLDR